MKLYIKQKVFSWGDQFTVKDEIVALAVVLTIDCVTASQGGVSVSVSSN